MKKLLITILICSSSFYLFAQSPIGIWKTVNHETNKAESQVKIYEENGKIYGKVIKIYNIKDDANPVCKECKDYRKNQPIIGMIIISGLTQDGKEWKADKALLEPKNGEIYDCKIWLENNNTLKVRGYVGFLFGTQTWHRIK